MKRLKELLPVGLFLLAFFLTLFIVSLANADNPIPPTGGPLNASAVPKETPASIVAPSSVYYTKGPLNLIIPLRNVTWGGGFDLLAKNIQEKTVTTGLSPVGEIWKILVVLGGAIDINGVGSPLGGGQLDFGTPLDKFVTLADLHFTVTGGYNLNEKRPMAVFLASTPLW